MNDVPLSTLARSRDTSQAVDQAGSAPTGPPPTTEYQTIIYTGGKMYAGTDALITMEVRHVLVDVMILDWYMLNIIA